MIGKDITKLQSLIDELEEQNKANNKKAEETVQESTTKIEIENVIE